MGVELELDVLEQSDFPPSSGYPLKKILSLFLGIIYPTWTGAITPLAYMIYITSLTYMALYTE